MIGVKNYYAYGTNSEAVVPFHFYLRTDGWLVVYFFPGEQPQDSFTLAHRASTQVDK
jgi:hypothetical protein